MVYLVMENNLTNQKIMNHSSSKHQAIKKSDKSYPGIRKSQKCAWYIVTKFCICFRVISLFDKFSVIISCF